MLETTELEASVLEVLELGVAVSELEETAELEPAELEVVEPVWAELEAAELEELEVAELEAVADEAEVAVEVADWEDESRVAELDAVLDAEEEVDETSSLAKQTMSPLCSLGSHF